MLVLTNNLFKDDNLDELMMMAKDPLKHRSWLDHEDAW
jgi:hypothetical protein